MKQSKDQLPYLFVKSNGRLEKITFDNILFIEGMENYVAIYCRDKKIITLSTIKALMEKLPATRFIQTHKFYIACIDNIDAIAGNILYIQKYQVPISKYLRKTVLESISR